MNCCNPNEHSVCLQISLLGFCAVVVPTMASDGVEGSMTFGTAWDGGRSVPPAQDGLEDVDDDLGLLSFLGDGVRRATTVFDRSPRFLRRR